MRYIKKEPLTTLFHLSVEKSSDAKIILEGILAKICCILMKIYPQTSIESKYGAVYSNNKVRVHILSFVNFTSSTEMKSSFSLTALWGSNE